MFPKPPKFVVNNKPVAVQVVQQKKSAAGPVDPHVLVVETAPPPTDTNGRQNSAKKQQL